MNPKIRFVTMLVFLLAAAAYTTFLTQASEREVHPPRESFENFPDQIGAWSKAVDQPLDEKTLELLKPDDYLQRTYVNAEGRPVYLFIAYYFSQRSGKTFHSPQNCLPGSGWEITTRGQVPLLNEATNINDFTIAKESFRMLTLYWYQGRGRTEASEYMDKLRGVQDAFSKNRTDAALVRVMVDSSENPEVEKKSREEALKFIERLRKELPRYIPE
jgi:EpsI family protein